MTRMKGVSIRKRVHGGDPCLQNTRLPTAGIFHLFMSGVTVQAIAEKYWPELSTREIETAIRFECLRRRSA